MFLNNYKKLLYTSVACISLLATSTANAAPQGGSVSNGIATIEQNNLKTDIYQNSDKAIIDWNSFDLNTNEQVQFHHPQTSSITLNRVHDTKTSQIDGLLTANGHVMIINENGVVFGENAHIDVGALTVTTADINNSDFMSGDFNFQHKGSADGHIINNGTISVKDSGLINLVAPHLENNGLLIAKMGKVQLAATQAFTLDLAGDGLIQIQIQESDAEYLIKNSGNIQSHDGYISLTTNTARNIVDSLVDNSGVLEATSLHNNGGKIVLSAHNGTTRNSGTIDSSGKNGGGTILIGGDYQGQGDIPTSSNTITTKTSLIKADAIDQGNGGKVIVWGDNTTVFAGNIEANGGENSGDGGFAETSGKANLHVENGARVNVATRAEDGKGGEWLLDPSNVLIQGSMGDNISSSGGIIDPSSDSYTINPDSITAALNNGSNVTITTTNAGGTQDGNIVINSAFIEKSTANNDVTLTFKAHHNIDISYSNIISSNDSLNIILNSDIDQTTSSGGGVQIQYAIIDTNGGDFIIGGGSDPTTMFTQGNTDLSRGTNGVFIQYATIETDAGDIIINGKGLDGVIASRGIVSKDAVFSTTSGDITLHGIGGTGGKSNAGISLENNGMQILSSSGHISITGETTDTLENAHSIILAKGADIILSDTASLEMVALSAATNSTNSDGVRISDAGTTISAVDGDIILRGSAMANLSGTDGILLYQEPVISSSGSGDIILEGSADSSGYAIRILGGTIEHTGTGSIYMTGTGSSTADVYVGTASTVTTSSGNGDIHISGNELYFLNTFNITSSDSIFITPVTDNTSIGLGVNGVSGTLNLINTELAGLSANTVVIGNQNTGTGTVAIDNLDLSTLSFDLEVYGGEQSLNGLTLGTGNFTAHAQEGSNITSTGSISKTLTGDGTLNLMAYGYISISNDIIASNGSLDIILNSDTNVNQKGAIYIDNSTIDSNNGDIILGGGLDPINDFAYGSQPLSNKSGIRLISSNISSGSGDISMKGRGLNNYGYSRGIFLSSSSLTTTSGDISLHGIGGKKGGGYNYGVFIEQSQSFLTSDSGHIDITAYTNNANQEAHAYFQDNGADIILNGTASLEINGHSGANNGSNSDGVRFKGTGTTVTTTDGDVILNGIAETDKNGVDGVILYQGASITGLGSGDIILNGTSAPLGHAVRMLTDTSITHSGTGDVRLSTTGSNIDALRIEDNSIIDTSAGTDSNIFLTTDSLRITSSSVTSSDEIYITPENDATTIGLGGGSGSLHLLSSEILSLSANTVIIGAQDTGTGTISINNPPISTIDFGLEIHGGDIIVDTGGLDVGPSLLMKASGDITLNGDVSANGSGNSLTLVTDGTFTNNAGSDALDAGSGRYLVYANNSADIIRGGLTGKSLYNSNYTNNQPSTISPSLNSRFVYNYQPTLTVAPKDLTINYYNPNYNSFTYYVSGLENGDLKNDAVSGTALYTTQETDTVTKRRITMDTNTLTSPIGYALTYPQPGYLTMLMQQSFSKSVMPQVSNTPGTRTSNKTTQTSIVTATASPTQGFNNSPKNALIKADKKIEIDFDLCSYNSGYCSE